MCKSRMNNISLCRGSRLLSRFLVVTMTVLVSLASAAAYAADPKVQIFSGTDEHWVPLQVAKAKGFFAAEGVDAQVTVFTTGATATEAFRAGRGDFISAGDLPSTAMWKTGNVIGVAPMSSDTEIFGVVGKSDISSPKDLRGRKVATRMGSTGEFLLYRYLESGNVMPSEVNIVDLAPPEMVLSLVHGNIDAFAWLAPFTTRAVSTGKNIKLISSAKGLANNRIILSVTKSLRDQKPDLVTKVLQSVHRAIEFTRTKSRGGYADLGESGPRGREAISAGRAPHQLWHEIRRRFRRRHERACKIHDAEGRTQGTHQLEQGRGYNVSSPNRPRLGDGKLTQIAQVRAPASAELARISSRTDAPSRERIVELQGRSRTCTERKFRGSTTSCRVQFRRWQRRGDRAENSILSR